MFTVRGTFLGQEAVINWLEPDVLSGPAMLLDFLVLRANELEGIGSARVEMPCEVKTRLLSDPRTALSVICDVLHSVEEVSGEIPTFTLPAKPEY